MPHQHRLSVLLVGHRFARPTLHLADRSLITTIRYCTPVWGWTIVSILHMIGCTRQRCGGGLGTGRKQ